MQYDEVTSPDINININIYYGNVFEVQIQLFKLIYSKQLNVTASV